MARPVSLRTEILLTLTILLGAALLLGGVLFLRLTEQGLLEERTRHLELVSSTVAKSLSILPATDRQAHLENLLIVLPDDLIYEGWWLYDKTLTLLAADHLEGKVPVGPALRQQAKLSLETTQRISFPSLLDFSGQTAATAFFIKPIIYKNHFSGLLEIRFSLDDIRYRILRVQKIILLYVFLYGAILVGIGYYLLQRNIIKPARNLLHVTEQVERGNLNVQLPVAGPVEISQLATAYNQMVDALLHSRQETREHIDALENTNAKLQQARDELIRSEKLASVGQLAAGLAHELGNPLAALIGYLEILKFQVENEKNLDILSRSIVEAQRIDFLVRELLDYSRPTETVLDKVDPVVELRKCLELLDNQGVFSQLEIVDDLLNETALVAIDRNKLQQVFVNILLNAKQACPGGGKIRVYAVNDSDKLSVSIADSGCGIGREDVGKIFDPFYTSKAPGEGTGLGLAICQRIIDDVGGEIIVESTEGQGSVFRISFRKSNLNITAERGESP